MSVIAMKMGRIGCLFKRYVNTTADVAEEHSRTKKQHSPPCSYVKAGQLRALPAWLTVGDVGLWATVMVNPGRTLCPIQTRSREPQFTTSVRSRNPTPFAKDTMRSIVHRLHALLSGHSA